MLSKMEIAAELADRGLGGKVLIRNILNGLTDLAAEEIAQGNDFTVPGIAKVSYKYTAAQKKGDRFKKGTTYVGFGGVETTAEADSPARKARVKLVAKPTGAVGKLKPRAKPEAQAEFLKSKAGKVVAGRSKK